MFGVREDAECILPWKGIKLIAFYGKISIYL